MARTRKKTNEAVELEKALLAAVEEQDVEMNAAEYASGEDILVTAVMHNAYNARDYTGVMAAHATWYMMSCALQCMNVAFKSKSLMFRNHLLLFRNKSTADLTADNATVVASSATRSACAIRARLTRSSIAAVK